MNNRNFGLLIATTILLGLTSIVQSLNQNKIIDSIERLESKVQNLELELRQ